MTACVQQITPPPTQNLLQRRTDLIKRLVKANLAPRFPTMHRGQARTAWVWRSSPVTLPVLFALHRPADVTAGGKERSNWSNYSSNYLIISLRGGEQEGGRRHALSCVSFTLLLTPPGHISKHYLSALPVQFFAVTRRFICFVFSPRTR